MWQAPREEGDVDCYCLWALQQPHDTGTVMTPIVQVGVQAQKDKLLNTVFVSGKHLSQDWKPRSLTPELNHTQYYHRNWKLIFLKLKESKFLLDMSHLLFLGITVVTPTVLSSDVTQGSLGQPTSSPFPQRELTPRNLPSHKLSIWQRWPLCLS